MVYVDHARLRFGRMLMSHMIADSREELLAVASKIGVNAKWLQKKGTASEHFDVCESMRAKAIGYGAIPVSSKEIVQLIHDKRKLADGVVRLSIEEYHDEELRMAKAKKTPVQEALERHTNELFAIDGVVGFMTKEKTIVVFVVDNTATSRVPKDIEGFPVEAEVTGEFRLMGETQNDQRG